MVGYKGLIRVIKILASDQIRSKLFFINKSFPSFHKTFIIHLFQSLLDNQTILDNVQPKMLQHRVFKSIYSVNSVYSVYSRRMICKSHIVCLCHVRVTIISVSHVSEVLPTSQLNSQTSKINCFYGNTHNSCFYLFYCL